MAYWPVKKIYLCPSCNATSAYDEEATNCKQCGTLLIKKCPKCQKDIKPDAAHCQYCGSEYLPKV